MVDAEIVRDRLKALEEYTTILRSFVSTTRDQLEANPERRLAVLHAFQVSIECVQDVAAHLIATKRLGSPSNHTDAIDLLAAAGVISADLSGRIRGMPGFRNVVVHEYLSVDLDLVLQFLRRLDDFEEFARAVLSFLEQKP